MHADRFGQIAIALCILRYQLSDARQNVERVSVIRFAQRIQNRLRELQHQQASARLKDAKHGGQRLLFFRDVAQTKGDGDAVEKVIGERQRFCVGLDVTHVAHHALIAQFFAAHLQHGAVDIRQDNLTGFAHQAREFGGEIAGTTRQI